MEGGVEVAHGLHQRVDGATVFQVAHTGYLQVLERALRFADGVEVEHTLRGVLVGTVAGVDDGHRRHLTGVARATLLGVAHHNEVGIAAHHHDGVVQRLALLHAGATRVAETDNTSPQLVGGTLKTETCACGGFKKKRSHHLVGKDTLFRILLEAFGNVQHLKVFFFVEVGDGDKVATFQCTHGII